MKKLFILLLSISLVITASAQKRGAFIVNSYVPVYSGFGIGLGYGFYPSYYSPYYNPYGYNYGYRPSKLDNQIADINHDYADKIESVRLDKVLSGKEKRQEIKNLKKERDQEIDDAKVNYHKKKS